MGYERCPECNSIFIQWNGRRFECLERICQHKWLDWPGGPRRYEDIENPHLKASLPVDYFPTNKEINRLELLSKIKVKVLSHGFMETSEIDHIKHWDAEALGNSFKNHLIIAVEKLPESSELEIEIRRNVGAEKKIVSYRKEEK